ncbi:MAG: hypothetical protein IKH46_16580, partial [Lachnospiraceae bacterium]|nr:hypothetical protein [Lachnospiraceae bacterium]
GGDGRPVAGGGDRRDRVREDLGCDPDLICEHLNKCYILQYKGSVRGTLFSFYPINCRRIVSVFSIIRPVPVYSLSGKNRVNLTRYMYNIWDNSQLFG